MEPKRKIPLYNWVILFGSILLISLMVIIMTLIITKSAEPSASYGLNTNAPLAGGEASLKIPNPDAEVRGIWIATVMNINFPSIPGLTSDKLKAELDDIIANTVKANCNAIYFQVRPSADSLYDSSIFPVSEYLTGKQGSSFIDGFDPFAYLIEKAHDLGIAVHAWVNPLRVTVGSAEKPKTDVSVLSATHPARKHPEWTVPYADGKLYFNAGLPEVRTLIADGIAEIVQKYDIDGVIFDDYFYPYPVTGEVFNDAETFKTYGRGIADLGDWRRENINLMIETCYKSIKDNDNECKFGVAPFGIWQNDDGKNGGSATSGLSSYSAIYCDTMEWVKRGIVDYVAPQIYWQFSTKVARFDVLARWWSQQLEAYPNVDLLICHAAYRSAEWETVDEIRNQIEYARSEHSYKGSILYGYEAIKNNDMDLIGQLSKVYSKEYAYGEIKTNGTALTISAPANGSYLKYEAVSVLGMSDPAYPLYLDGKPVGRTKSGYFSLYLPLDKAGANKFIFLHKGIETVYTINKGAYPSVDTGVKYAVLDGYAMQVMAPVNNLIVGGGTTISLRVSAPSKSKVIAKLGTTIIELKPTINPPDENEYMKEIYVGSVTVTKQVPDGMIWDLGNIIFGSSRGVESSENKGINVRVTGKDAVVPIEVLMNDTELKVGTDSWYYDDFTPSSAGMRDNAVSLADGYYKLRVGGYVAEGAVKELPSSEYIKIASVKSAYMATDEYYTSLNISISENVPFNGYVENGQFILTLYNVNTNTAAEIKLKKNPLFTVIENINSTKANSYKYVLDLKDVDNFYGFSVSYKNGCIIVCFRNPVKLPNTDTPLKGKVIVLDAGHGGAEHGTDGFDNTYNEAEMNLDVVLEAEKALKALGADVRLIRNDDSRVYINDRLEYLIETNPDLMISIHQNAVTYSTDITKIRGLIGLYYADSGLLLTKCVSNALTDSLNRFERSPKQQRLAMVRNPKFPSTLIEVSFLTCAEEYENMRSPGVIKLCGESVAKGVLNYYAAQAKYLD